MSTTSDHLIETLLRLGREWQIGLDSGTARAADSSEALEIYKALGLHLHHDKLLIHYHEPERGDISGQSAIV